MNFCVLKIFKHGRRFLSTNTMENPIVTITEGKLKGAVEKLCDGRPYYSFKGIPYAQPPVGTLRFKAPQPPKPWQGVYEACTHGQVCPQYDMSTIQYIENNGDCLFVNVYSPSLKPKTKLPVILYIHGGGFASGSGNSDLYGPEYLLQHNVVLVTINYRLEVLGFLCLDTPEVPGNAGMKDQVAAMRWVKKNIEQFGGDSNNITLMGESAGGASVTCHMMSPMSKGLFHKAIVQSGVCINDWCLGRNGKERAFRVGALLGNNTNDPSELLKFLQEVPIKKLLRLTKPTATEDEQIRGLCLHFVPIVEKKFNGVEAFLTEPPINLLMANKIVNIPMFIGYNTKEGCAVSAIEVKRFKQINETPSYNVPREIMENVTKDKFEEFGHRIKKFYVGDGSFSQENLMSSIDKESDIHFIYNTYRFLYLYSLFNKENYLYRFDCDTELNFLKKVLGHSDVGGACHAEELFYLFKTEILRDVYEGSPQIRDLVFKITKLWTNFAKTGDPTPDDSLGVKWTKYNIANDVYFNIDEKFSMEQNSERQRIDFWNNIYRESGLACISKSNL